MAWLSGWSYRESLTFDSNGISLSGNVTDKTVRVNIPSSDTDFWANVKADGTDVRFTGSDGETLLKFEIESFDNTGDDAWYHVKIPTVTSATDTVIYIYYGNSGASSGEDITNTWDSSYKGVWHLNEDSAAGAFADSTSNNNDGTNNGTTTATGQIDKGRNVNMVTPTYISIADSDSLTFASAGVDTPMTITAWAKMTDATRFRIFSKGSTGSPEYHFVVSGADTLILQLQGVAGTISRISSGTLTADEGAWIQLAVVYDGSEANSGITLYRNGAVFASSGGGSGSYTGMQNTALAAYISNYYGATDITGSGVKDEVTISAAARSADWLICDYQSGLGTWLTIGGQEQTVIATDTGTGTDTISVDIGASAINITDTGLGTDEITSIIAAITLGDTGAGSDTILVYSGDLYSITETGSGLDSIVSLAASLVISESASGADSIYISGIITPDVILESVHGFAAGYEGQTEYKVVDEYRQIIEDWTAAGVFETPEDGVTSSYSVKIGRLSQYTIFWRISGTKYKARRTVNLFESNNDAQTSTRLAAADYTAPDNAGIAALQTDTALLLAFIRNKKYLEKVGAAWFLVIRNADDTADILRKALKGPNGTTEITDIQAAALGMEMKTSV